MSCSLPAHVCCYIHCQQLRGPHVQLRLMRETLQTAEEPTAPHSVTLSRRLLQDNIEDEQVAAASTAASTATSPSGVQAMPGVGVSDTTPGQVTAAAAAGAPVIISTQHVTQSKPSGCPGMVAVNKWGSKGKWQLERRTERSCTPAGQLEDDQRLAQLAAQEKLPSSWCVLSADESNNNLAGKETGHGHQPCHAEHQHPMLGKSPGDVQPDSDVRWPPD